MTSLGVTMRSTVKSCAVAGSAASRTWSGWTVVAMTVSSPILPATRPMGRVGIALDRARPPPLLRAGEQLRRLTRAREVRDAAPRPREPDRPRLGERRPDLLSDALLLGRQRTRGRRSLHRLHLATS